MKSRRDKKAAKVLAKIYQTDEKGVEEEIDGIRATLVSKEKKRFWHVLRLLFNWKNIQRLASQMFLVLVSVSDPKPTPARIAFSIARYTGSDIRAG